MGKRGPRPKTLARWLRSLNPETLTVESEDGDKTVKVGRLKSGVGRWNETVQTLESLGATRVEALDDEGKVLGVWHVTEASALAVPAGFVKDPADTNEERMLKTFAHLLSDAYKTSIGELVRVMALQGQHFSDERKAGASAMLSMDRAMQRMARSTARFRISGAAEADGGEGEVEDQGEGDTFVRDLVQTLVSKKVAEAVGTPAAPPANGKGSGHAAD